MTHKKLFTLCLLVSFFFGIQLYAKVDSIRVTAREIVMDGESYGEYGPWELIKGKVYFSWDPSNQMNQRIVDIGLAERNQEGLVTAVSDLVVLKPAGESKTSELALVEVSNRGGKFTPSYFNRATSGRMSPDNPEWFGNGLTLRKGMTVIWVGWQFDVPEKEDNLAFDAPKAYHPDGSSITGLVRSDWVVDETVKTLKLGHRDQIGYPVYDFQSDDNLLTVRDGREAPRDTVPRSEWRFARQEDGEVVKDSLYIYMEKGFQEGKIYELVYQSHDPPVVGTGMAAIRDIISYAKYDENALFPVDKGIAAGVSQTGRFLRHLLYQDFNTDENFRQAYDGLMIMTAGAGRGSFNHRFAQPSRDAHRYSAFFYPTDLYPFTSRMQFDSLQWRTDGLMAHFMTDKHIPKVFYINTGYEYWGRAASLIHTSVDGEEDINPLPNERIYHIGSGQHFVDGFPPQEERKLAETPVYRGNPLAFKVNYRALLVRLSEWVTDKASPPESEYPKKESGNLVRIDKYRLPEIPGLAKPSNIHKAYRADYGPRWSEGIVDIQPPLLGETYISQVSQVDEFGNEVAGIQNVEGQVPVATYTPWSSRKDFKGSPEELVDFRGNFIPLPKTAKGRNQDNDPRPAIEELYDSKGDYLKKVQKAADQLVEQGFLLKEDKDYVINRAEEYWNWIYNEL